MLYHRSLMYKDEILNTLSQSFNTAQFISFSPNLEQRFSRITGFNENTKFSTIKEGISNLINSSIDKSVNIRSYHPENPQSNEFVYGIKDSKEVMKNLERLSSLGLFTIVNETIDINDGGVSGVLQNDMVEFSPGDIPRFVENSKETIATIKKKTALKILQTIYGVNPELDFNNDLRVEFSLHPRRQGWKQSHTIIWEVEKTPPLTIPENIVWPTSFSKLIGDKAYGLVIAHSLGIRVPKTSVFSRNKNLSMFSFGETTGSHYFWTRTCPITQQPGKFTTIKGFSNPFDIMDKDDPAGKQITSCLIQQEVNAIYSGALITSADSTIIIEGVEGYGDNFMQGIAPPFKLPQNVIEKVTNTYNCIKELLGAVRFEWVYDGSEVWILQLHSGKTSSIGKIIYPIPENATNKIIFHASDGLTKLRKLIATIQPNSYLEIQGNIGFSSHIADVLRKTHTPSKIS